MALSDLAVFNEYAYDTFTEVLQQQIQLFNEASAGAIVLSSAAHQGDYSERAFFQKISGGLVRRRNAYGSGSISQVSMTHLTDTMVKIASGTPEVLIPPSQFKWIQQDPEVAGAAMGQQLAVDTLADMLNTSVAACAAALSAQSAVVNDISGGSGGAELPNFAALSDTAMKFGDANSRIAVWVMHSYVIGKLYGNAIANGTSLFTYGNVNVVADPFGRRFIVSDIPGLIVTGSPNKYRTLGLTPGAIAVDQNDDFTENWETSNGDENIQRSYQAEWSYNLGIKGFTWDKGNGSHSPNQATILTASNWDKIVTDNKDLAGVLMLSK